MRLLSTMILLLAAITSVLTTCKQRKGGSSGLREMDGASEALYFTGKVVEVDGSSLVLEKPPSVRLRVRGTFDRQITVGRIVHVQVPGQNSDILEPGETPEVATNSIYLLKNIDQIQFPAAIKYDQAILGATPFSVRTIYFAKVYDSIAKGLALYLNESNYPTTFHFEPFVMTGLSLYLTKIENAQKIISDILTLGISNDRIDAATAVLSQDSVLFPSLKLCSKGAVAAVAIKGFLAGPRTALEVCKSQIDRLYQGLTDLNLYLFRHNAGEDLSPYIAYFKAAAGQQYFNGRVNFADDINGILAEAFYQLYLAANLQNDNQRAKRIEKFNLLVIGHEQILAQEHYDKMIDLQEKLAGELNAQDALGVYKLSSGNWGKLSVRMSLNVTDDSNLQKLNPGDLLNNKNEPGSIPHYFRSRLLHPNAKLLMSTPNTVSLLPFPPVLTGALTAPDLIRRSGCNGCHEISGFAATGNMAGPSLRQLKTRAKADDVRESITNPDAKIATNPNTKKPYPHGVMPSNFSTLLTEAELNTLVSYLLSQ